MKFFFFCPFKAEFFNICFFLEETVVKGFIDVCVCDTYDSYGGVRKNLLSISNFQLFVFFHCRHKMKYYQDSSVIRSWFVYLVLGLKKALPRNSTKVKVEPAGFSQQITRKVSDLTYSLSGAASGVSPYSFCLLLFREGGGGSISDAEVLLLCSLLCSMKLDLLFSLFVLKSVKYNFLNFFFCCCFHNGNHR